MKFCEPPPSIAGMAKSVSASVPTTSPAPTSPGLAMGRTICQRLRHQFAPRLHAAVSVSRGMAVRAGASISTAKGSMYCTRPKTTAGKLNSRRIGSTPIRPSPLLMAPELPMTINMP